MVEHAGHPRAMISSGRGGSTGWSKWPMPGHQFLREVVRRAQKQGIGSGPKGEQSLSVADIVERQLTDRPRARDMPKSDKAPSSTASVGRVPAPEKSRPKPAGTEG